MKFQPIDKLKRADIFLHRNILRIVQTCIPDSREEYVRNIPSSFLFSYYIPFNVTDLLIKQTNFYQKPVGQVSLVGHFFCRSHIFFNKAHIVSDFVFGMITDS